MLPPYSGEFPVSRFQLPPCHKARVSAMRSKERAYRSNAKPGPARSRFCRSRNLRNSGRDCRSLSRLASSLERIMSSMEATSTG